MPKSLQLFGCLAVIVLPLAFMSHVQAADEPATSPAASAPAAAPAAKGEWQQKHEEMRNEAESLHTQHEKLVNERDTLKMQCMNAKGQDRVSCTQKMKQLHEQMQAVREKHEALHGKVEKAHQMRKEHRKEWKEHHDATQGKPPANSAAPSEPEAPETP